MLVDQMLIMFELRFMKIQTMSEMLKQVFWAQNALISTHCPKKQNA